MLAWSAIASHAEERSAATLADLAPELSRVRSTGQPTERQLEEAATSGVRTVINLRADGEPGFEWESSAAERLGLRYVRIPIAGPDALTRETVARFDAELRTALEAGPVLVHCASGNRNGALFALREAWLRDAPPERAVAIGRAAGLTRLEPAVRTLIGLPAADSPAPAPAK